MAGFGFVRLPGGLSTWLSKATELAKVDVCSQSDASLVLPKKPLALPEYDLPFH